MGKKITYDIGFNVDKNGLKTAQQELQKISNMSESGFRMHGITSDFKEIKTAASQLQGILERSFNTQLGTYNIRTLHKEILALGQNGFKKLQQDILKAKELGVGAFSDLAMEVLTTNNAFAKSSKLLSDLGKTLGNTIKWSISSSLVNAFTGSIQKAWSYAQKLDESLNNIRIVTGKSAEDMENFAKQANKAAKSLGASTTSYTNAALIYYQQGLGEKDVQARTKTTLKAANVTGQSAAEVSEQLTAVWNGYKVVAEEAELYVDKLAAVAATTAADLEELSTGMSKVASAANAMGVDVDQLSAQLATIVSVTRQDASVVGTALKTIYSRMGDLKVSGVDEFGTSLGDVSGQLKQMGINVLDQEGNLRDMGIVIEEVAAKWGTWTNAQQQAAAVAIAGKRQYNNLIALFENWDMYESSLATSQTSEGTLQKQQEIYLDSLEAKLQKLGTSAEKFYDNLIDTEATKGFIEVLSGLVDVLADVVKGFGGAGGIITQFGSILLRVFSGQVIDGVKKTFYNINVLWDTFWGNTQRFQKDLAKEFNVDFSTEAIKEAAVLREQELTLARHLTDEEKERYEYLIKQRIELGKNKAELEAQNENLTRLANGFGLNLGAYEENEESNSNIRAKNKIQINKKKNKIKEQTDKLKELKNPRSIFKFAKSLTDTLGESTTAGEELRVLIADWPKGIGASKEAMEQLLRILKEAESELDEIGVGWDETQQKVQKTGGSIKKIKEQMEALKKEGEKKAIQGAIADTFSTAMAALSIFTSVNSLIDDTKNGSLSVMEVIGTIFSLIISGAPAVIGCIKLIGTAATGAAKAVSVTLGIIGLVGVAAAVLIPLFVSLITTQESALEKANKALEKAKESAKAAREEYAKLNQELEDLNSTIGEFKTKELALDSLIPGTVEYTKAINELNNEILSLVEKYPQLAQFLDFSEGRFIFEDDALENLQNQLEEEKSFRFKQIFSTQADIYSKENNSIKNRESSIEEYWKNIIGSDNLSGQKLTITDEEEQKALIDLGILFKNTIAGKLEKASSVNEGGLYGQGVLLEDLQSLDDNQLTTLLNNIDNTNGPLYKTIETMIKNREAQNANTTAIEALNETYNKQIADELGWKTDVGKAIFNSAVKNSSLSGTITEDYLKENIFGKVDVFSAGSALYANESNSGTRLGGVGVWDTIDNFGDLEALNNVLRNLANEYDIKLTDEVSLDEVNGKKVHELRDLNIIGINGKEASINDLFMMAATAYQTRQLTEETEALTEARKTVTEAGLGEWATVFAADSGNYFNLPDAEWTQDYNQVSAYLTRDDLNDNLTFSLGDQKIDLSAVANQFKEDAQAASGISDQKTFDGVYNSAGTLGFNLTDWKDFGTAYTKSSSRVLSAINNPMLLKQIISLLNNDETTRNTYIGSLGMSGNFGQTYNEQTGKWENMKGYSGIDIYDMAVAKNKLELDYTKKIADEMDRAFGPERLELLEQMSEQQKQTSDLAIQQFQNLLAGENGLNKNLFMTDGQFDYIAFLNYYATLPEGDLKDAADSLLEAYEKAEESAWAAVDAKIEEYKYQQEMVKTLKDMLDSWNELNYEVKKMGVSIADYGVATFSETVNYLTSKWTQEYALSSQRYKELSTLDSTIYSYNYNDGQKTYTDEAQFWEDYGENIEGAISSIKNLISIIDEMFNAWEQGLKEIQDSYDNVINSVSSVNKALQSGINIAKMIGSDMEGYYSSMINYNEQSYGFIESKVKSLTDAYKAAVASGNQELIKKARDALVASTDEITKYINDQMTLIQNRFSDLTEAAVDKILGKSLSVLSLDWGLEMAKDEMFLDEVNEQYALDELNRSFQKAIDETDNMYAQNKLMEKRVEIEEELTMIKEEQGKLTQYDIDRANALYDITLKQIALEEAQQTASKMKLVRDSSGNYTYQYVQDADAVADAEAELAAASNNLYNLEKDRKKELVNDFFSMWQEYQEKMKEAMETGDQELQQRVYDHYFGDKGLLKMLQTQLGIIEQGSSGVAELFNGNYDFSGAIINFNDEDGSLSTIFQGTSDALSDLEEDMESLFGDSGTLTLAINELTSSLGNEGQGTGIYSLESINDSVKAIIGDKDKETGLYGLSASISAYMAQVTALQTSLAPYVAGYLENLVQATAIDDNTKAVKDLTGVALEFIDTIETNTRDYEAAGYIKSDTNNDNILDSWIPIASNDQ